MTASKCPLCGRAPEEGNDAKYRPFCSRRCADLDLGRWLGGGYAIPGEDGTVEIPDALPGEPPSAEKFEE